MIKTIQFGEKSEKKARQAKKKKPRGDLPGRNYLSPSQFKINSLFGPGQISTTRGEVIRPPSQFENNYVQSFFPLSLRPFLD